MPPARSGGTKAPVEALLFVENAASVRLTADETIAAPLLCEAIVAHGRTVIVKSLIPYGLTAKQAGPGLAKYSAADKKRPEQQENSVLSALSSLTHPPLYSSPPAFGGTAQHLFSPKNAVPSHSAAESVFRKLFGGDAVSVTITAVRLLRHACACSDTRATLPAGSARCEVGHAQRAWLLCRQGPVRITAGVNGRIGDTFQGVIPCRSRRSGPRPRRSCTSCLMHQVMQCDVLRAHGESARARAVGVSPDEGRRDTGAASHSLSVCKWCIT